MIDLRKLDRFRKQHLVCRITNRGDALIVLSNHDTHADAYDALTELSNSLPIYSVDDYTIVTINE